jgi:multidrug efflux pump subunit AcrB
MSVVSGASTTVGANLFLLGCTLTFFTKFGTFVAWTLSVAMVQAVVVFPAACAVCGPEGVRGGVRHGIFPDEGAFI